MSIRAVPSSAMTTTPTPDACRAGMASTIPGSTIITVLTDGTAHGTVPGTAPGMVGGMTPGTTVMQAGMTPGIMATMATAGAGLTADGTAGVARPTITTTDTPVDMQALPTIGLSATVDSTMRQATDQAMADGLLQATSPAIAVDQAIPAQTIHGLIP